MHVLLKSPIDVQRELGQRAKVLRLAMNLTQSGLADRVGISVGTIKRFERTGEIQLAYLLKISLVLSRLEEFDTLFLFSEKPKSLFEASQTPVMRQRGRKK